MTATIATSSAARDVSADVIVIGISQGQEGPVLADGAQEVDAALGGNLIQTLTALGATGKAEEITKTLSAGALGAPLIAAVGLGKVWPTSPDTEALRRAAGAAVRALSSAKVTKLAFALPASDAASAEAVAVGSMLGSYYFGKYRSNGHPAPQLTLIAAGEHVAPAVARAQVIAAAMNLVRDLVNTSPSHLYP